MSNSEKPAIQNAWNDKGISYMHTLTEETRAVMRVIAATSPMDGEQILSIEIAQRVEVPHTAPEFAMPILDQTYERLRAAMLARKLQPLLELCYMGFVEQRAAWPDGTPSYDDILFYLTPSGREYCEEGYPLVTSMTFRIPE